MAFSFLIVDDSRSLRKVLIKTIRMCNLGEATYHQADHGLQALDILSREWVDLIFTDLNMPEMDGYALIGEIRKNPVFGPTPIVVITSETRRDDLQARLGGQTSGVVTKPFRPEEIRDMIVKLLKLEGLNGEPEGAEGYDF
jgi:two-component system, chemotaxis family, chemotaxis protein CheY